jgi:hypothetical protein
MIKADIARYLSIYSKCDCPFSAILHNVLAAGVSSGVGLGLVAEIFFSTSIRES